MAAKRPRKPVPTVEELLASAPTPQRRLRPEDARPLGRARPRRSTMRPEGGKVR